MKKQAFFVGAFAIGALALIVLGVYWLSGASLFHKQIRAVIYFEDDVAGLYIGAPVTFRGVPVGQVDAIGIEVEEATLKARIPVQIRITPDVVRVRNQKNLNEPQRDLPDLVQRGLRARLVAQSFVTGQKSIDLDIVTNAPPVQVALGPRPEIPVQAARFDALVDQLADVPLRDIVVELRTLVTTTNATLDSSRQAIDAAKNAIAGAERELAGTGAQARLLLQAASTSITQVQRNADAALASVSKLAADGSSTLSAVQPELQRTLGNAREASEQARVAMQRVADLTAADAPLRSDLEDTLAELAQAVRGLRELSDLLQEQPNALVFGRRRR